MKKFMNNKLLLILGLILTILLVSGGTFAYFQWQSSLEDKTNVIVSVTDNIEMRIDPAEVTKTGMRPTNNCGGEFAMSGNSLVTIDNNTGILARPRFNLKLKITDKDGNNITNENSPMGNPYRQYIKYVVTETNGDCTSPLSSGRFNLNTETSTGSGWYESSTLTLNDADGFPALSDGANTGVSFDAFANRVTTHTYKVWIWIDETYTAVSTGNAVTVDKLQDATVTVSWSDNSTVEQVHGDGVAPSMPELTGEAYAVYSADDTSLRFYRSETPIVKDSVYNGKTVTEVYTGFEEGKYECNEYEGCDVPWYEYSDTITKVVFAEEIVPISTAYWFWDMVYCNSFEISNLNTFNVNDMSYMFYTAGVFASSPVNIIGLENMNTLNVTNMEGMLSGIGYNETTYSLDLSGWDTSKVTDMSDMFYAAGENVTNFSLDLSGWDTSKVTDMSNMFFGAGYSATNLSINLSSWDVSKVTNVENMFYDVGASATTFSLQLSGWNFESLEKLPASMFSGNNPTNLTLDLSDWNVNNIYLQNFLRRISQSVTGSLNINLSNWDLRNNDATGILYGIGQDATNINLDLSGWKISNTTNINKISTLVVDANGFNNVGKNVTGNWTLDVSGWDLTNVTDLSNLFYETGSNKATEINIIGLNTWNVSNVTNMEKMFYFTGEGAANNWSLDLSGWNVCKVTSHDYFNSGCEDKVIQPNWDMACATT